ncbi:MAG: fasciclin domain-containing protein [Chitinophagaceae bacterium]|nr:MAG: fasciclin domain-containing protein [Chitinophagaceae bacterium]
MKFNFNKIIASLFIAATAFALVTSCNKDVEDPTAIVTPQPSGQSMLEYINADANLTILKAAVARASTNTTFGNSLNTILGDKTASFTFFAPTDAAFQAAFTFLGIPQTLGVNALRPGQLDTILRYHFTGGRVIGDTIGRRSPNVQLPTQLVLQAPNAAVPGGLRMSVFPSRVGTTYFVNNVPVAQADIPVANGVVHKIAAVLLPPTQFLWDRINTDANLTYLKAAVQRADSGVAAASTLTAALQNPGANLTVFAPTDAAFRTILTAQITQALVLQGVPLATAQTQATALASTPAVFTNLALSSVLTPTNVRGLVAYHLLGNRRFSVNIPTTATAVPTVAHGSVPTLPLLTIQATLGATGVTAATVKGGANTTPSNIQINPTPAPAGTSDQNYINGVLHIIDQVLRPQ